MIVAVWGHPCDEFADAPDVADAMARRLELLHSAGVDRYFAYLAVAGKHYFESETLGPPARDLLAPLMAASERTGVQVHPVFGLSGESGVGLHHYRPPLEGGHVPEAALTWSCAAWGENHERSVLVAHEILQRYAPAGLHLDTARYPDASTLHRQPCACDRCLAARTRWLGKPYPEPKDLRKIGVVFKEMQMRMEFVRSFVESLRGLTDHHGVALSAAVRGRYYEDALEEGQDWPEWCAEGLLDVVCPLSFALSLGGFAAQVAQHRRLLEDAPVAWVEGIGLRTPETRLDFDGFERQVIFARDAGASGVCIADAGALGEDELAVLRRVAG